MNRKKKKTNTLGKKDHFFQEKNTRKPCRRQSLDEKYQKKIAEKKKNPKNKKKTVRAKTKEQKEDEEYHTLISPDEMFLSLPRHIQCRNNGWKPYWDAMVQKNISHQLSRLPLLYSRLNEYNHLISLQRSFKMLALSKILISECNFFSEYDFELNIFEIIQIKMKNIDTSRYQEWLYRIEDNERRIDERERIIEHRERLIEHRLNSDLWY
jgi:hypothetical protein